MFVSYATADRKEALAVCKAIESRRTKCWISCRDVKPGENYQEAIVRAIRSARTMVLVFSDAANNSDEIKKELSLASKAHVPVMALRIEDVEPSDAFAYELSTRQWVDAFEGWDGSIDSLVAHIEQVSPADPAAPAGIASTGHRRASPTGRRGTTLAAVVGLLVILVAGAGWWFFRPAHAAAHSMVVRLTGFSNPSHDLPASTADATRDEIIAAFNDDGVVGVSTAAAPPAGTGPAYALGGTIRRDGDKIKVNVRLTNERSGVTLWSNIFTYDSDQLERVPRQTAVNAGNMMRCGLFGASTYDKPLPDPVLTDYMQVCHNSGIVQFEPGKALISAKKVVAAAPDFSWGWSAVANAAFGSSFLDPRSAGADDYRKAAGEAADKAISLDASNSEALDLKALLVNSTDFLGQEVLLKKALAARPLPCGCEHHLYGLFLQAVGRNRDAVDEFRRSTEVLALDFDSQLSLADALVMAGRTDEAKAHFDAAVDLWPGGETNDQIWLFQAPVTGDYAAALKGVRNPKLTIPDAAKAALVAGYQAMISNDAAAKSRAAESVMALPMELKARSLTTLLAALGDNREALQIVVEKSAFTGTTNWLFLPAMRGVLADPAFPAAAQRLGLMKYWKATHTRPDVCAAKDAPPFCRTI